MVNRSPAHIGFVTVVWLLLPSIADAQQGQEGQPRNGDETTETAEGEADPDPSATEETPVGEVVITATRRNQSRMEASVAVDRIDTARMNETMPVTVADVVAETPGVALNSPAGVYFRNPSIRGLGGRRVIMVVDGARIDTEKTVGVTGYFVDVGNVERVEVLRGPGSVLYGSDALGGVINILTVSPLSGKGWHARTRTTVASNNNEIANWSSLGWADDSWGLRLSSVARDAQDYRTGNGNTIGHSFYQDQGLTLDLARRLGEHHTVRVQGSAYRSDRLGKAVTQDDDDKLRRIHFPQDDHDSLQVTYEAVQLTELLERFVVDMNVSRTLRTQRGNVFSPDWSRVVSRTDMSGDFLTLSVGPNASLVLSADNVLTVGADGFYKHLEQRQTAQAFVSGIETRPQTTVVMDGAKAVMGGVYAQDEHRFGRAWRAIAGVRGDIVHLSFPEEGRDTRTSTNQAMTGNAGVVYQPIEAASISVNVGRAFRAPTLKEKFVQQAACKGILCGKTSVKPEKTWNFDFGVRGTVGHLSYEMYDFVILADDFITLTPSGDPACDYDYTNVDRSVLYGGETRWRYGFDLARQTRLDVWTSGAAVMGQDWTSGMPLPGIPPLQVASGVRLWKGTPRAPAFYVEADVQYEFAQDRIAWEQNEQSEQPTGAYALSNAGLGFRVPSAELGVVLQTFLRITNLANTGFRDHLSQVEGMGRNVKLGLGINYE